MQAFRVIDENSTTPISEIAIVSVLITVTDVNDNAPVFLNPAMNPIFIVEVSTEI